MSLRVALVAPSTLCAPLVDALRAAGHTPLVCATVDDARARCEVLIVRHADDVVRVRAVDATLPILVLDAHDDDDDNNDSDSGAPNAADRVAARVAALAAGADDALSLPAAPTQFVARVGALGRRAARTPRPQATLEVDGCVIDLDALTATRDGVMHVLTALEARLLGWLRTHAARAVPREELLVHVWGASPHVQTRTIDMTVARLRKKLERDPDRPRVVLSIKGVGYRLGAPTDDVTRK